MSVSSHLYSEDETCVLSDLRIKLLGFEQQFGERSTMILNAFYLKN